MYSGICSRGTIVCILSKLSGFKSPASLFQISILISPGVSAESTPNRFTPFKINGNTLVLSSGDATNPQVATLPFLPQRFNRVARVFPPTVSIAPAHAGESKGLPELSETSSRLTQDRKSVV